MQRTGRNVQPLHLWFSGKRRREHGLPSRRPAKPSAHGSGACRRRPGPAADGLLRKPPYRTAALVRYPNKCAGED